MRCRVSSFCAVRMFMRGPSHNERAVSNCGRRRIGCSRMGRRVRRASVVVALVCALLGLAPLPASAARGGEAKHVSLTFVDRSRPQEDPTGARSAPVRTLVTEVYVPRGKGPFPLVMFAHGNAGNPGKLTQLLSAWARAGYV